MELINLKEREIYAIKRKRKKIRLTHIAQLIGCSPSLLSRYENGECGLNPDKLAKYQSYIDNHK